jgi:hypothetical protein
MAILSEFYKGIDKSRLTGWDNLVNLDVHSEIGYASPQLALAADATSNVPDEACIMCKTPVGTIYAFSTTSGKRWKYSSSTWSAVTANAVETTGHHGARYYNGKVYFSTSTYCGRFTAETEASIDDDLHTWSNVSTYRPMEEINLVLYIGNGKDVGSVNSSETFADSAIDTPPNYTVTALVGVGVDLLIGTVVGSNVNFCKAFLWDTYSDSWTIEDEIPEIGVNCFIKGDNIVFAQCGTTGQLYYWSGQTMTKFRKIRGITTTVAPYNSTALDGRSLFAAQGKVFSIHRSDEEMPYAIVQEYTTTSGNVNSINAVGTQLLVSAGTHIDKTGTSYATAVIDTQEVTGNIQSIVVAYDSLPTSTSIAISTNQDQAGYSAQTTITDTIKKTVSFDGGLLDTNFIQSRITLTSSGTSAPKIRTIEFK